MRKLAILAFAAALLVAPAFAATTIGVNGGAAMQGSFGMQVNFDGAGGNAYVQDNSPNSESEYWVSLRLNDNSMVFNPAAATRSFQFLRAFTDEAATSTVFRINVIDALTPGANLRVFVLPTLDAGTFHPLGTETFITTSAAPPANNKFVFEWKAATAVGANNGRMVTYRDGILRKQITNLDNDTIRVGMVRMGGFGNTVSVDSGSSLYLDDFVSTRTAQTP